MLTYGEPNTKSFIFRHKLVSFTCLIILLFLIYEGYIYFSDQSKLGKLRTETSWLEGFYTANGYFPNVQDFNKQFPNPGIEQEYSPAVTNWQDDLNSSNPAWNFDIEYKLTSTFFKKSYALGYPDSGEFGFEGDYHVLACPRWNALGFQTFASDGIYAYPPGPGGGLRTDFYKGTVYFTASDNKGNTTINKLLLSGLDRPRILSKGEPRTFYITNGDSVYSYIYDGAAVTLSNPVEIGKVPTQCPSDY